MLSFLSRLLFLCGLSFAAANSQRCKCIYGQPCWPTDAQFQTLASQLSQPLLRPTPPAAACYPSTSVQGNCTDIMTNWVHGRWRANQPGAMQNTNYETHIFPNNSISACYINTSLNVPCGQGSVPPIGVNASSVHDLQAAIKFAGDLNLRFVVKNTGHDYLGRSTAQGAFLIWTHFMKERIFNPSFVPEGATDGQSFKAVTLGAGVQWHEAYDFAAENGRFIVGGISNDGSVGSSGGWISGGGHSAFAPFHGLGVDNVLQFNVLLANGSHITVNDHRNPSLFWALRGGGGGSYGIITSVTYKTHDQFPLSFAFISANFTFSPTVDPLSASQSGVTEYVRLAPSLADAGWGGYSFFNPLSFVAIMVAPNVGWGQLNETIAPFVEHLRKVTNSPPADSGEPSGVAVVTAPFESFHQWLLFNSGSGVGDPSQTPPPQVGGPLQLSSRLMPRQLAVDDPEKAAKIMLSVKSGIAINAVAGGAVSKTDPDAMALNPAWRKALLHVIASESWEEGASPEAIQQAIDRLKESTDVIDQLTDDSASYLNEASLHERDFKKSFFGRHYDKLRGIKATYDPASLFVVPVGVGSDEWDEALLCRR